MASGLFQPGHDQSVLELKNLVCRQTPLVLFGLRAKELVIPLSDLLKQQRSTDTLTRWFKRDPVLCVSITNIFAETAKVTDE